MKFCRFRSPDTLVHIGILGDDVVHVIPGADDIRSLIESGGRTLENAGGVALGRADNVISLQDIVLLSPIATPPTIRDFYSFEDHVKAGRASRDLDMDPVWYKQPVFYFSNPYAVTGVGEIPVPPGSEQFDYELEVAAIIGSGGRNVTPEEADELIVGFCIMNDWSARDIQQREMSLSLGPVKGKDTATSLGPWLVTKDELEDFREGNGYRLKMTCSVNSKLYSEAWWSDIYWSFGEMISYATRGSEVRPGDVLGSGTCGSGCILELAQSHSNAEYPWLKPGDSVVAAIEKLGELRNFIVPGEILHPLR